MTLSKSAQEKLQFMYDVNMRDAFANMDTLHGIIEGNRLATEEAYEAPEFVREAVSVRKWDAGSVPCVTLEPREGAQSDLHVIYYHGGGFVMEIGEPHWAFCLELVKELSCKVTTPIYPLYPFATSRKAISSAVEAYAEIVTQGDTKNYVVMGDSAGGTLSLAVTQAALKEDFARPVLTVGISPWTDIDLDKCPNREIPILDPLLDIDGLWELKRLWRPEEDSDVPSILDGPFEGMNPVLLTVGTCEHLYPDSPAFAERAMAEGVEVELEIGEGLWHTYPLMLDIDEGKAAFDKIVASIKAIIKA